jgi:two-component system OmpR family response regulator
MRLLVIEDDLESCQKLRDNFAPHYVVDCAHSFDEGIAQASTNNHELIIIGLSIFNCCGLKLIREIRAEQIDAPILAIGDHESKKEVVQILNCGGDDLLIAPFTWSEFHARINALLRRHLPHQINNSLQVGSFEFNLHSHHFTYQCHPLKLQRKQCFLFECLIVHFPHTVLRAQLVDSVWENDWIKRNNIDVLVSQLRKSLQKQIGFNPIKTIHGLGYRLDVNQEKG